MAASNDEDLMSFLDCPFFPANSETEKQGSLTPTIPSPSYPVLYSFNNPIQAQQQQPYPFTALPYPLLSVQTSGQPFFEAERSSILPPPIPDSERFSTLPPAPWSQPTTTSYFPMYQIPNPNSTFPSSPSTAVSSASIPSTSTIISTVTATNRHKSYESSESESPQLHPMSLTNPSLKREYKRTPLPRAAKKRLKELLVIDAHPDKRRVSEIAEELGMDTRKIRIWFQNQRSQMKANGEISS
ncbi:hypothetical protein HDU79_002708 [Rhizoclosmatium sp. JEL0117]|nr:hypothetical protein HDU79_002708 [Rhizoclosmatium sp. JEL0117]